MSSGTKPPKTSLTPNSSIMAFLSIHSNHQISALKAP